jgi:hypothetical protein
MIYIYMDGQTERQALTLIMSYFNIVSFERKICNEVVFFENT